MTDKQKGVLGILGCIAAVLLVLFIVMGPAGIRNKWSAWQASAYGSDWLVVQYTGMGEIQNTWDLKNCAIHSESSSDGIYFTTDHGVVHLSGHYIYIQNPSPQAKELYLKKQPPKLEKK